MQIEKNIINNKRRECMQTNVDYTSSSSTSVDNMFSSCLADIKDILHYHNCLSIYNNSYKLINNFIFATRYRQLSALEAVQTHDDWERGFLFSFDLFYDRTVLVEINEQKYFSFILI